jgi:uncharacterized protein
MLLVDTNVWLALAFSQHPFNQIADAWLSAQTRPREIFFCRFTQLSFLRLLTTAAIVKPYGTQPLANDAAWTLYDCYLADPRIAITDEPPTLDAHWKILTARSTPSPKLWMDAYLAAFALAGRHQLVTNDQAFTQFKELHPVILSTSTRAQ